MEKKQFVTWLARFKGGLTARLQERLVPMLYELGSDIEITEVGLKPVDMALVLFARYRGLSMIIKACAPATAQGIGLWLEIAFHTMPQAVPDELPDAVSQCADEMGMVVDLRNDDGLMIIGSFFEGISSADDLKASLDRLWFSGRYMRNILNGVEKTGHEQLTEIRSAAVH